MPTITFVPSGMSVTVETGAMLTEACRRAGFPLPAPCGGKGLCGKCRVRILEGDVPAGPEHRSCLPQSLLDQGWRAACVVRCDHDMRLADPQESTGDGVILTDFQTREAKGVSGIWQAEVRMTPPSTADQRDDLTRLKNGLHDNGRTDAQLTLPLLRRVPNVLRGSAYRCRVIGLGERVLDIRPAASTQPLYGVAVDLGTTTIAAALCEIETGRVIGVSSCANPQRIRGDDVISRAEYAMRGWDELAELQLLAVEAVENLCHTVFHDAGIEDKALLVTVAGNTVMTHLLAGLSPASIAVSPFIPVCCQTLCLDAGEIGWHGDESPLLVILPTLAAYVGGDITAGILAHDLHRRSGVTLFLDAGTNGEIALSVNGTVYACATAAGPAFEGARIRYGMRAEPGAISSVTINPSGGFHLGVVDDCQATGICGTGLLDAVAALVQSGLVDESGRILEEEEINDALPLAQGLKHCVFENEDGLTVRLTDGEGDAAICLTQRDIREFQLAKGAIAAGARVLLGAAGVSPGDVDTVLLAGGMGNYLDPDAAIAVGLLPAGIDRKTVRSVGNAALAGARLCLVSEEERDEVAALARAMIYIELSGRDDFQTYFAEEMLFPEPP